MTINSLNDLFNFLIQNKLIGLSVLIAIGIVIKWIVGHPWISEQIGKFLDLKRKEKVDDIDNQYKISNKLLETSDKLLNGMFETNNYFKETIQSEVHKLAVEQDLTRRLIQGMNDRVFSYGDTLSEIKAYYRWLYLNEHQTKIILSLTIEWMQYKIIEIILDNKNNLTRGDVETHIDDISIKIHTIFNDTFEVLSHFMSDSGKLDRLLKDFIEYEKVDSVFSNHAKKIAKWNDEDIKVSIKNLFSRYVEKLFKHYL